jgi:hypothetical protein
VGTRFSAVIWYAAIPALAVAGIMTVIGEAGTVPGSTLGFENIAILLGAAFTVSLLPFFLLVSSLVDRDARKANTRHRTTHSPGITAIAKQAKCHCRN